jgi:hypothetical protein
MICLARIWPFESTKFVPLRQASTFLCFFVNSLLQYAHLCRWFLSFSSRSSSFFIKSRLTILSFRSFRLSSRSKLTLRAISRMMFVFMHDMSTWTRAISSICSPMKSRHSRTSLSIFKNSAGIRIVTAFLYSNLGPS